MNCIFCCIFNQEKYVDMAYLLLESIFIYGELDCNTYILIYTSTPFMNMIKESHLFDNEKIIFEINDTYNNIDKACKARLDIFDLPSITNYNKILYLDTDILVKDDISKVFNVCKEDILYVLEEAEIDNDYDHWGKSLFGNEINNYNDKSAFTSGILLFNNCEKIKDLFNKIKEDMLNRPYNFDCYDQPYIIYNSFKYNLYNNKILKSLVVNYDNNIHSDKVIHHFPGGPGIYQNKIDVMTVFLNNIKDFTIIRNNIKPNIKICQHGEDGFGHQLEGTLRMISLSLNNKADYIYNFKTKFEFVEGYTYGNGLVISNFDTNELNLYLLKALEILYNDVNKPIYKIDNVVYGETRTFEEIKKDENYSNNLYCYDGVGSGHFLPNNFEYADELKKSLPKLRNAFVLSNTFLPKPSCDINRNNIVCDIRLGDAVSTGRILDNNSIFDFIKKKQLDDKNYIVIHSDDDVSFLKSNNTIIYDKNTNVLQVLSDFIHAKILVMNYSSLSISAHLIASDDQIVFCPNIAGPTFYHRILNKCIKLCNIFLENKTYTWEDSYIRFLDNFKMDAFGEGDYTIIDKQNIIARFGGRIHNIMFNDDYTEFSSTRTDDLQIVNGKLIIL